MTLAERYARDAKVAGACPIESGYWLATGHPLGRLADHECKCPAGRLPFDRTPPCGCWPQEGAQVIQLPVREREAVAA